MAYEVDKNLLIAQQGAVIRADVHLGQDGRPKVIKHLTVQRMKRHLTRNSFF